MLFGFRDILHHGGISILNPDAKVLGGVTEFMKVAVLAQAHGIDVAPHGMQEIHIHMATAIPNGLILEYYSDTRDPMWLDTSTTPLMLNDDGTVSPPDTPGIGVEPNWEALRRHRVS